MANEKKTLVRFNIKNAAYSIYDKNTLTAFGDPVKLGYADSISLEADYAEKVIYGDGKKVAVLPNDKGKTGTLTLLAIDEAYEIAMKRRMKIASGTAEIKQAASIEHALYFETDYLDESGNQKTAKTILYGVTSGRPSEAFNQTTDDINNNNVSYPITIKGIELRANANLTAPYVDSSGNRITVWQQTSVPGDPGYEDFGKTITVPAFSSGTAGTSDTGI